MLILLSMIDKLKKKKKRIKKEKGTLVALEFQYIILFQFLISNQTVTQNAFTCLPLQTF